MLSARLHQPISDILWLQGSVRPQRSSFRSCRNAQVDPPFFAPSELRHGTSLNVTGSELKLATIMCVKFPRVTDALTSLFCFALACHASESDYIYLRQGLLG